MAKPQENESKWIQADARSSSAFNSPPHESVSSLYSRLPRQQFEAAGVILVF